MPLGQPDLQLLALEKDRYKIVFQTLIEQIYQSEKGSGEMVPGHEVIPRFLASVGRFGNLGRKRKSREAGWTCSGFAVGIVLPRRGGGRWTQPEAGGSVTVRDSRSPEAKTGLNCGVDAGMRDQRSRSAAAAAALLGRRCSLHLSSSDLSLLSKETIAPTSANPINNKTYQEHPKGAAFLTFSIDEQQRRRISKSSSSSRQVHHLPISLASASIQQSDFTRKNQQNSTMRKKPFKIGTGTDGGSIDYPFRNGKLQE